MFDLLLIGCLLVVRLCLFVFVSCLICVGWCYCVCCLLFVLFLLASDFLLFIVHYFYFGLVSINSVVIC